MNVTGSYPFGSLLRSLVQQDRSPKKVFVLGVYASAVHAKWFGADGRLLVRALAVASEPRIFWDGNGADDIINAIKVPVAAGHLEPADSTFNGPSGRSLDEDFLGPLGITRDTAWLCDLVPYTCLNPGQLKAIKRAYVPRMASLGLPEVDLPSVPKKFADDHRREEVLAEVVAAEPEVVVLLGDQPIRNWLRFYDKKWSRLSDFGDEPKTYGRLHEASIAGKSYQVLPVAHPRQVGGLGTHSAKWRELHEHWKVNVAGRLL